MDTFGDAVLISRAGSELAHTLDFQQGENT